MSKILLLIAGTVISVNLVYVLLPSGSFEKYCRYIFGLILILVFVGSITNVNISSQILDFNNQLPVYNNNIEKTINNQTEKLIESRIKEHLVNNDIYIDDIYVVLENNDLKKVTVISKNKNDIEKVLNIISSYCDIEKGKIVVE